MLHLFYLDTNISHDYIKFFALDGKYRPLKKYVRTSDSDLGK